ncbi:MAG: HPr family phosphocarrier protein [Anaerostipes sp.]|jgi:phosphocarrier protein HPr|nr:HPr family phosphocarrier protein [Anaerostipes sp.]MDD3746694.1 HPr family phosphocarrier protein [Anaerostipes sp.]
MKSFDYVLKMKEGLHAKPAVMLSQLVVSLKSKVIVRKDDKKVNAVNMPALLTLRAYQGEEVIFEVTGEDEDEDIKKLKDFCEHNL